VPPCVCPYLPFEPNAAHLFFQLVSCRYEKDAILLTSNRSVGEQGAVFGDPVVATAILDRLLHHSDVTTIRCDSYRLKEKRRSGLLQKPAAADQSRRKRLERCPEHRKPLARYDISRRARIAPLCQRM